MQFAVFVAAHQQINSGGKNGYPSIFLQLILRRISMGSRKIFSDRRIPAVAMALAIAVATVPVFAADGTPGTPGMNGTSGQPTGQPGGAGGDGSANSTGNAADESATNTGGVGGAGGSSFKTPFPAGAGGAGGGATALSDNTATTGSFGSIQSSEATATGGAGGVGGAGGPGGSNNMPGTNGGAGGNGGSADVFALDSGPMTNPETIIVTATGVGGAGGAGGAGGLKGTGKIGAGPGAMGNGGAGGSATLDSLAGNSESALLLRFSLTGGVGGAGANGGAGGSETFIQTATGGQRILENNNGPDGTNSVFGTLTGGIGGDSTNGTAGNGGAVDSEINLTRFTQSTSGSSSNGTNITFGGNGGDAQNGNAGNGGNTTATIDVLNGYTVPTPVTATATANNPAGAAGPLGAGGNVLTGTGSGGTGGNSVASAIAGSNDAATATAIAYGGAGGSVSSTATGNGGAGGIANATAQAATSGHSTVNVMVTAVGGAGGAGSGAGFTGGTGGGIISDLTFSGSISGGSNGGAVTVTFSATGGAGGFGFTGASGGNGANVMLDATVQGGSTAGIVLLSQTAIGGAGGGTASGPSAGTAGTAESDYNNSLDGSSNITLFVGAQGGNGGTGGGAAASGTVSINHLDTDGNITVEADANSMPATPGVPGSVIAQGAAGGRPLTNGPGGDGAPGTVTANVIGTNTTLGHSAVTLFANAYGGPGGSVLRTTGSGGNGSLGTAAATASNAGRDPVQVTANAFGGNGGAGEGTGFTGGFGGGASLGAVSGTSTGAAPVTVSANATGGNGGAGTAGANAGNGAPVSLANIVTGSSGGNMTLHQQATGGNGGSADGGIAGIGGDANSTLSLTINGAAIADVAVSAFPGAGGANTNGNAGNGGNATAALTLFSNSQMEVDAIAAGTGQLTGAGGAINATTAGFKGGNGGISTASATATGNGSATSQSVVGSSASAGGEPGGTGTTVQGGFSIGSGGNGGDAIATAISTSLNANSTTADATASPGNGGNAFGAGQTSGNGGNATAIATALSQGAKALALANAFSGQPGASSGGGAILGTKGTSNATATASALTNAQADAMGNGSSGLLSASAHAGPSVDSKIAFVQTSALVSTSSPLGAEARSLVNQTAPTYGTAQNIPAASYLTASPLSDDVTTAWTGNANVQSIFSTTPANVSALGLATQLNLNTNSPPTAIHTYSTVQEINLDASHLASTDLVVGLLGEKITGIGMSSTGDTLRFRILRSGTTLVDQTFTSNASAQTFLNNTVFDLGVGTNVPTFTNVDLQVLFDLTSASPESGVGAQFAFGSVTHAARSFIGGTSTSWTLPGNWQTATVPNGPGAAATLAANGASSFTVALNQPITLGNLKFGSTAYTVIPGTGSPSLTFDNAGTQASLSTTTGNQTIAAPILFSTPGLTISAPSGSSLTLPANISGPGTLALSGTNTLAKILLAPSSGTGKIAGLTFATASLDIANNKLIIELTSNKSTVLTSLETDLASGFLLSSDLPAHTAIAIIDNATLPTPFTTFGGLPTDTNSILIAPELLGDTNIDGTVNMNDLTTVLNNLGTTQSNWTDGDFDGQPTIDLTDLNDVLNNLGSSFPNNGASIAPPAPAPAPEPASLLLVSLTALPLLTRRRPK
jgi:hypothetical protein